MVPEDMPLYDKKYNKIQVVILPSRRLIQKYLVCKGKFLPLRP